jgi:pimeloyl-ACP methyl ester carboxylesterase
MTASLSTLPRRLKRKAFANLAFRVPRLAQLLMPHRTPLAMVHCCGDQTSKVLVVCLPGIGDIADDFNSYGFATALGAPEACADVVAVDAHYGYYAARTVHDRLTRDVIAPARQSGYREIWLTGVSLGGFGALSYAMREPGAVTGLILLAPYLGPPAVIQEISAAGGLQHWEPESIHHDDYGRVLWHMIKQHWLRAPDALETYLGFGQGDWLAPGNQLLADILPSDHVFVVPGGHEWRTWRRLWDQIMSGWSPNHGASPRTE